MMFNSDLQNLLQTAGKFAIDLGHRQLSVTHVLYVAFTEVNFNHVFASLKLDKHSFIEQLHSQLTERSVVEPIVRAATEPKEVVASHGLTAAMTAWRHENPTKSNLDITISDLIIAVLKAPHVYPWDAAGPALFFKMYQDRAKSGAEPFEGHIRAATNPIHVLEPQIAPEASQPIKPTVLDELCIDLSAEAAAGRLDDVNGRDDEIERVAQVLLRRRKNNPILLGEPGVGKTAIAEGLAVKINKGTAPSGLLGMRIYNLDIARLSAGASLRGQFEERLTNVLDAAASDPKIILFMDEIHTLIKANGTSTSGMADILKPALASGKIRCIGATTRSEYSQYLSSDPALARRFMPVEVKEPSRDQAISIILQSADQYVSHHQVTFTIEAVEAAVDLSIRYMTERSLPDKAFDIIDEACSQIAARGGHMVNVSDVIEVIRSMTGDRTIGRGDEDFLVPIKLQLREVIQPNISAAIEMLEFAVRVSMSPLRRPTCKAKYHINTYPGAGHSFVCRELAKALGVQFLKIDMASLIDSTSINTLVGSPNGYIGSDHGGQLTEFIRQNPNGVVLLDNFAAAHPAAQGLLAGGINNGVLLDGRGRRASLANMIIIIVDQSDERPMTSFGFTSPTADTHSPTSNSERHGMTFDRCFIFDNPTRDEVTLMLASKVEQLNKLLLPQGISLHISPAAMSALIDLNDGGTASGVDQCFIRSVVEPIVHMGRIDPDTAVEIVLDQADGSSFKAQMISANHEAKDAA